MDSCSQAAKVLLIHPGVSGEGSQTYPPWGALYLAQHLELQGVETAVLDCYGLDVSTQVLMQISAFQPTIVGITGKMGVAAMRMRQAIEAVKASGCTSKIAVGGPLVASFPDPTHPLWHDVDALFKGDGEQPFTEWIRAGGPPGTLRDGGAMDLGTTTLPTRWESLGRYVMPAAQCPGMRAPTLHVSAARGCTRRCRFCYLNSMSCSRFRRLETNALAEGISQLTKQTSATGFYFVDDCFLGHAANDRHGFVLELGERTRGATFGCSIQLSVLEDGHLLEAMLDAGFRSLYVGVESASRRIREHIGKDPTSHEVIDLLQRAISMGFSVQAALGVGWPGETPVDVAKTLDVVASLPELLFDAYRYLPLPDTPLLAEVPPPGLAENEWPYMDYSTHNAFFLDGPWPGGIESPYQALLQESQARYAGLFAGQRENRSRLEPDAETACASS